MKLSFFAATIALLLSSVAAPAQTQPHHQAAPSAQTQVKPANIDRNGVLMLIRSALLAVDQANKTGNYTVLHDLGAPGFQAANNPARLGDIFAKLRNDKVDLSGVAVIDPQLSLLPQIEANGMMHMAGFFPSVPSQVNFELIFAPVEGQWRVFGISVAIGQSAPIAPEPQATLEPSAKQSPSAKQPPVKQQSAPVRPSGVPQQKEIAPKGDREH